MLIAQRMIRLFRLHLNAFLQGCQLLTSKRMTSFLTTATLGVTLTFPTLFWIVTHSLENFLKNLQAQTPISLYLSMTVSSKDTAALLQQIKNMPSISEATFISPTQGLSELEQAAGIQTMIQQLSENPLPGVIQVTPIIEYQTPEMLQVVVNQLKILPHVAQTKLDLPAVERWDHLLKILSQLTHLMIALLAVGGLLIITNTLHLIFHQQHTEIYLLQLLGATSRFIGRPFIYTGMAYGFFAALLAIFFVKLALWQCLHILARAGVPSLSLANIALPAPLVCFLIVMSLSMGWLSAKLAVFSRFNGQFDLR